MSNDDMERRLMARLDEKAASLAPRGLSEVVSERVQRTRQVPSWATTERWISMETRAQFGAVPRAIIVLATLALLTALAAGAIAIGASIGPKLPDPFGAAANGRIAFVSEGDIYTVESDGSDRQQITSGPRSEYNPMWSRDGTRLAYWSDLDETRSDLVVTDADGGDPLTIGSVAGTENTRPEWSSDGAEVMFSVIVPELAADPCPISVGNGGFCGARVFVAATDGSGARSVGDPDLDARSPTLSPDGRTVAFGGGAGGSAAPYLMDWDGSNIRALEGVASPDTWAFVKQSWSFDGEWIATHDGRPSGAVWLVRSDGSGATQASEGPGERLWPSYAPDGSAISWRRWNGGMEIWSPDEGTTTVIPDIDGAEDWSPDGTMLITTKHIPGKLVIIDRDGTIINEIVGADDAKANWQRLAIE